jgi:hypothetical protein
MIKQTKIRPWRRKDRFRSRDLMADDRCMRAVLDFLNSTDMGRRVGSDREAEAEAQQGFRAGGAAG